MQTRISLKTAFSVCLAGMLLAALWGTVTATASLEETLAALDLEGNPEQGMEIYEEVCQSCHMPEAKGDPAGSFPQLAGQHATVIVKQIADIRAGNRDNPTMRPFAKVSSLEMAVEDLFDDEKTGTEALADVAAYIQSMEQANTVYGPGDDLQHGETVYRELCESCHLDRAQGSASDYYPVISGQNHRYLVRQFEWIRNGKRRNANPETVRLLQDFSDRDMQATMDWVSRQKLQHGDHDG